MNQEFMEEHPGVTIEYEAVTGDDYRTVLQTALRPATVRISL